MVTSRKIEYSFISLGLIFGLLFVFLIPPLQAADEDSHFKKAFLVASFNFFPEKNPEGRVGNYIPQSILDFENEQRHIMGNIDAKYDYKNQYIDSHVQVNKGQDVFIEYSTSKTNPILFIPQSLGMLLLKLTVDNPILNLNDNISPINYLYIGRIFNLIFYLLTCFYAIKLIPFMKNTLFLLCMMPMTLSLSASLSYDGIIIGIIFLFISLMLKTCYDIRITSVSKKLLYSLIVFSAVIIQFKQIYFPLVFLFLLIPISKFKNKKEKNIWFLFILGAGFVSYLCWSILSSLILGASQASDGSSSLDQIKFILGSPFEYIHILIRSIINNLEFYFISFVGNLGWLDTNFPYVFTMFYFVVLIISAIMDNSESIKIPLKHKGFIALVSLSIIVLIETALYVIWTSLVSGVGSPFITGVQGRYFIPISLIILIIFKINIFEKYPKKYRQASDFVDFIIPRIATFSMILTTIIILLRYWIPFIQT